MPTIEPPVSMGAFPSATLERVWTFPFALSWDRAVLEPADLNYDLHVDTFPTFASPNAMRLTKTSAGLIGFQEGDGVGKAFEVQLPGRGPDADATWYWRVRVNTGAYLSAWSQTRTLTVPKRRDLEQTQELYDRLADDNSYDKFSNSANTYKLALQVGRELDLLLEENRQSKNDLVLDAARDAALVSNFSAYLGLQRSSSDVAANHRWRTRKLWKAFMNYPGTVQGMLDSVTAFVAEPPTILDLTSTQGWILDQNFIKVPDHPEVEPVIVIYSRPQRGTSFVLTVFNSWGLTYDRTVLERFVKRMKPAHAQMTLQYSAVRHWSSRHDLRADWELWTRDGNEDLSTYPNGVAIAAGQTTTTMTSPVLRVATASGYDAPLITTTPSGQTVQVSYRTSQDGSAFSSWVDLNHGVEPDSSIPIGPYMQFRAVLTRATAGSPTPILNSFEFVGTRS